jgi:hypothetical protein
MATRQRNKQVPAADLKDFILEIILEKFDYSDDSFISSKVIGKAVQKEFNLDHPMSDAGVRNIVNRLRYEDGKWQINASKKGYKWSTCDRDYQKWKHDYQSQIASMIRCLHKIENSYVNDFNIDLTLAGDERSVKNCVFEFFPHEINWNIIPYTKQIEPSESKPKRRGRPVSKKAEIKKKCSDGRSKNSGNGEVFILAKKIRKDGEAWLDAVKRAFAIEKEMAAKSQAINDEQARNRESWSDQNPEQSSMLKKLANHFNKNKNNKK